MDILTYGALLGKVKDNKPTDAQVAQAVEEWLDDHPEATTTVQDGAITYAKLDSNLQDAVDEIPDLKSQMEQCVIKVETNSTYNHPNTINPTNVRFLGNALAFRPAQYANGVNYCPDIIENGIYNGVNYEIENQFYGLNGEATASGTKTVGYVDFSTPLEVGTYRIIAQINVGESVIENGNQFGVVFRFTDNTTKQQNLYVNAIDRDITVEIDKPVNRISTFIGVVSGNVFSDYRVWIGVFASSTSIVSTGETVAIDGYYDFTPNADLVNIYTCQHQSIVTQIANTKDYIDALDVDINEKLTYVTPERFGAVGDGEHDDYNALALCIQYAIVNNVPVRANKKYYISSGLVIECDDLDLFINQIITQITSGDVAKLTGYRNRITINYIYAYNGNCNGFHLYGKSSHWSEFNTIHIPYVYASQNAIVVDAEDGAYACENTFYTQYIRSTNLDCIYIGNGYGENVFYGGGQIICPNGWAITCYDSGNKFYNFALESQARSGIRVNGYNNAFHGFRIAELRGQKTPTSGDVGTLIKFVGMPFANLFECADIINYTDIDISDTTPVSDLTTGQSEFAQLYNIVRGIGVRSGGYIADMSNKGFYTCYGTEMYVLHDRKVVTPYMNYTMAVDADVDLTGERPLPYPTGFKITSAATITLSDSYCCIGFKHITIDQTAAKCTVYDKDGQVIFDGTNLNNSVYELTAEVDPADNIFNDKHSGSSMVMYDGTNDIWTYREIS